MTCFVVTPVLLATSSTGTSPAVLAASIIFFLAAVYRLARFDVEGLQSGRYAGVPVTYNGYVFPAAALASYGLPGWSEGLFIIAMLAMSALMITRRVTIPEL